MKLNISKGELAMAYQYVAGTKEETLALRAVTVRQVHNSAISKSDFTMV